MPRSQASLDRTKTRGRDRVALNVMLSGYDEAKALACRECRLTYMLHEGNQYTVEQPTAFSKTPSLTGPGVFGLGTRNSQTKANGKPL